MLFGEGASEGLMMWVDGEEHRKSFRLRPLTTCYNNSIPLGVLLFHRCTPPKVGGQWLYCDYVLTLGGPVWDSSIGAAARRPVWGSVLASIDTVLLVQAPCLSSPRSAHEPLRGLRERMLQSNRNTIHASLVQRCRSASGLTASCQSSTVPQTHA